MSETPISDSTPHNVADLGMLCRTLERQLNAANAEIERLTAKVAQLYEGAEEQKQRIKRLEEMYEKEIGENDKFIGTNLQALLTRELNAANERIKRLEEQLMNAKNKHAVLVADVALYEDRGERIKQLEDRIHRAGMAFFRDGSDGQVASGMLAILEEERRKQ